MKKLLSRTLSCTLVLYMLSTLAMAAEVTQGEHTYRFSNEATESGTFTTTGEGRVYPLYTVPVGTKIAASDGSTIDICDYFVDEDGTSWFIGSGTVEIPEYTVTGSEVVLIGVNPGYFGFPLDPICVQGSDTGAQPTAPTTPTDTTTTGAAYTVVKYDTLGQIALNNYGSYKHHTALYKANAAALKATGGALKPGMALTLPDTLGSAKRIGMPVAGDGETLYTVQAGDTLGSIATAIYGDAMKYKAIFERNSDRLTNANTIYEGQIIVLPVK